MGTFNKGILGGFSGKVGTVVGSNWRGLNVMRSLPKKSGTNPTPQQLEQRQKFAAVTGFLSPITALLSSYYGNSSGTSSRFNNAMSYHLKQGIMGTSPNFAIDYAKVVLTKGEVIGVKDGAVSTPQAATVQVNWADNSGQVLSEASDLLLIVLFNSDKSQFVVQEGPVARQDLTTNVAVPPSFAGDTVHAWLSFVNTAQKRASTSVYLGSVIIT